MIAKERRKRDAETKNEMSRYEAMILPHRTSLLRAAFQLTRNAADAEDLVQKTLIRAFTHWHTYRAEPGHSSSGVVSAGGWLRVILRNLFVSDFNRQKRKNGRDVSLESFREDGVIVPWSNPLSSAGGAVTPERAMMAKEEFLAVRGAMRRLPEAYSAVLSLAVEEGLLYDEIAVRLSLPIGTVRSRLHRARRRIEREVSGWRVGIG